MRKVGFSGSSMWKTNLSCRHFGQSTLTKTSAGQICLSHAGTREPNLSQTLSCWLVAMARLCPWLGMISLSLWTTKILISYCDFAFHTFLIHACSIQAVLTLSPDSASNPSSGLDQAGAIGVGVGVPLLVLVICVPLAIVCVCCCRRRYKKIDTGQDRE